MVFDKTSSALVSARLDPPGQLDADFMDALVAEAVRSNSLEILVREVQARLEQAAQERSLCVVCLEEEQTHALIPCGHRVCCATCSERLKVAERPCPLCRKPIEAVCRVYV